MENKKKSLALLASIVAASSLAGIIGSTLGEALAVKDTTLDGGYAEKGKNQISDDTDGILGITSSLAALVDGARGACSAGLRCLLATTVNDLIETDERFQSLNLDTTKVGSYALSVSGNQNKARIIGIIENKDDGEYVDKILNNFKELKIKQMEDRGLDNEVEIAKSMQIAHTKRFTSFVMNPNVSQSMSGLLSGVTVLENKM